MRISTEPGDPAYRTDCYKWDVTLDGDVVKDCITADEEQSLVVVLVRDEHTNKFKIDPVHQKIVTEVKRGLVHLAERKEKFQ
jgi:hypothetical protein